MNAPVILPVTPADDAAQIAEACPAFYGLTEKQQRFVDHWARYRNAGQAYRRAFDVVRMNAQHCSQEGRKLLERDDVKAAIRERQTLAAGAVAVDVAWLLNRFLDIATADPRELIGLRVGCCRFCHGEGFGYQWREREYLEACAKVDADAAQLRALPLGKGHTAANALVYPDPAGGFGYNATHDPNPDCPQCHGEGLERFVPRDTDQLSDQALLLFGGVKVKADGGYEIVIADQQKALEAVGRIMGAFTDKVKHSGTIGVMAAIGDLRKVDPQDAAKAYRQLVAGELGT